MRQKILSESEFEGDSAKPSADNDLESHRTLDKKPNFKATKKGGNISIVAGGPVNDGLVSGGVSGVVSLGGDTNGSQGGLIEVNRNHPGVSRDQINNLSQKEAAMAKAGVTREKTYEVIARLLDAKKWSEVTDKQGNVRWEEVADLEKQKMGADMALKAFGDMVERKEIEVDAGDNLLAAYRGMSVSALKARAAEILLGRSKPAEVVDAEVRSVE